MRRSGLLSSPRDDRPGALVKIIERDLCEDLHRGNRTRQAEFPGDEQADHERVDRASDAPTDGLDERARVRLALRRTSRITPLPLSGTWYRAALLESWRGI
jgi:hypothetical protein